MRTLDGYELCLVDTEYDEPYNMGKELLEQDFFIVLDEPQGLEWWDTLEDTMVYTMEIIRGNKMHSLLFVEKSEEVIKRFIFARIFVNHNAKAVAFIYVYRECLFFAVFPLDTSHLVFPKPIYTHFYNPPINLIF